MACSPALKRYNVTVLGLSGIYAAALIGVGLIFRRNPPAGILAYALAIVPALPIIGVFVAIGRYLVEERDEYLRMLMVRQSLVASGFALSVTTVWGFLEGFDLVAHFPAFWFAVLWFGGLAIGACVNRLTIGKPA